MWSIFHSGSALPATTLATHDCALTRGGVQIPAGGKKSRSHLILAAALPAVVALAQRVLCRGGAVLAYCGATEERAVVVATALVAAAYATVGMGDRLELRLKSPEPEPEATEAGRPLPNAAIHGLSKHTLRAILVLVQSARPHAESPPRPFLQQLNRHFLSLAY